MDLTNYCVLDEDVGIFISDKILLPINKLTNCTVPPPPSIIDCANNNYSMLLWLVLFFQCIILLVMFALCYFIYYKLHPHRILEKRAKKRFPGPIVDHIINSIRVEPNHVSKDEPIYSDVPYEEDDDFSIKTRLYFVFYFIHTTFTHTDIYTFNRCTFF